MLSTEAQKIWTAISLSYPNRAQARSIFIEFLKDQNLSQDMTELSQKDFKRLFAILMKTQPFQSAQLFGQYRHDGIKDWESFYKRTQRLDLVLVLSLLVLQKTMDQLASVVGIPSAEISLKVKKAIQKKFPLPAIKSHASQNVKLRQYRSDDKSAFFIREKLIEYVFADILKADLDSSLWQKIDQFEEFKLYTQDLNQFKKNILKMNFDFDEHTRKEFAESQVESNTTTANSKNFRNLGFVFIFILTVVAVLVWRPDFIKLVLLKSDVSNSIELQQVKITRAHLSKEGDIAPTVASQDVTVAAQTVSVDPTQNSAVQTTTAVQPQASSAIASNPVATTAAAPSPKNPESTAANKPNLNTTAVGSENAVATNTKKQPDVKNNGVFRGTIHVNDIQAVAGLMRDRLVSLGGQKAGEVELGWMKSSSISYFHFLIPKDNQETFLNYLKQFGTIQVKFENHPRVLPQGTSRYIIEVKLNE